MERLVVSELNHSFGFFRVLEDINFTLNKGSSISIVGPSGGGKSTLLRLCAGLLDVKEGSVENSFANFGFAFQDSRLLPWKNVIDNISLGLIARGEKRGVAREKSEKIAVEFGLDSRDFDKFPKDLSGGMRQRVSFARALVLEPSLIFLDEPFSALDIGLKKELQEHLVWYMQHKMLSVLLITHDILEAIRLSDTILLLKSDPGRIVKRYDIDIKKSRRDDEFVFEETIKLLKDKEIIDTFELEIK